jgi:hypothetical protein
MIRAGHGCAAGDNTFPIDDQVLLVYTWGIPQLLAKAPVSRGVRFMALISCPKCSKSTAQSGFAAWQIIVAICFFPLGMLALLAGRKPTICSSCGNIFQT